MSVVKLVSVAALFCVVLTANADYSQYDPDGSGSWSDETRWVDGKVPKLGDTVRIGTAAGVHHVVVTDQDLATFLLVGEFRLYGNSSLTISFSEGQTISALINGDAGGKIIKEGGDLTLAGKYANSADRLPVIQVNTGTLTVRPPADDSNNTIKYVTFCVASGATLNIDASKSPFLCNGLEGTGSVTTTYSGSLDIRVAGGTEAAPHVFSGTVLADNVFFSVMGGAQFLPCAAASWNFSPRLYLGYLGFDNAALYADPIPSDHGVQFQGGDTGGECGLFYLGANGECNRTVTFYGRAPSRIDGGAVGGLSVTGKWTMKPFMNDIVLSGSNMLACVLSNELAEDKGGTTSASITKRGTGIWRLGDHGARKNAGLVAVEQGRLEYASIAEAGTICSLGLSTLLYEPHFGAADPMKAVPYALRVGNGVAVSTASAIPTDLATLTYVGAIAAACTTRPVAIDGAGRLGNDGAAALSLRGVTSIGAGEQTLVLSGGVAGNRLEDVTNGVGALSIVKEGAGTWTLARNIDIGGDLVAKGGTLALDNAIPKYRWYRLRIRQLAEQTDEIHFFEPQEIALFNADGVRQNLSMTYQPSANGNPGALGEKESAFGYANPYVYSDYDFNSLFDGAATTFRICPSGATGYATNVDPDKEDTWPTIVMRVAEDADPIARYDIQSAGKGTYKRSAWSWVMEGSVDGAEGSWKELHAVTNNPAPVAAAGRWYSSDTENFTTGYAIVPTGAKHGTTMSAVRKVEVSGGATISSGESVTVGGIRCDVSSSGGTLDGFAFAGTGMLEIVTRGASFVELPIVFRNATNLENVADWTLMVDGKVSRRKIRVTGEKVYIDPAGLMLTLR